MVEERKKHGASSFERLLTRFVRPVARNVMYRAFTPPKALRPVYAAAFDAQFVAREAWEMAHRALVATPMFLARCAVHGERIAVDRVPYMTAPCRVELGSDIRISGQITISASSRGAPCLQIGDGVFLGHGTSFAIANRVTIGNFVSIGAHSYIADTDGHRKSGGDRPIWEVLATEDDIAPVVLEDGVQVGRGCTILKGVRIGARTVVGAGSVVRSSVPCDAVVMGNPARVVSRAVPQATPMPTADERANETREKATP